MHALHFKPQPKYLHKPYRLFWNFWNAFYFWRLVISGSRKWSHMESEAAYKCSMKKVFDEKIFWRKLHMLLWPCNGALIDCMFVAMSHSLFWITNQKNKIWALLLKYSHSQPWYTPTSFLLPVSCTHTLGISIMTVCPDPLHCGHLVVIVGSLKESWPDQRTWRGVD